MELSKKSHLPQPNPLSKMYAFSLKMGFDGSVNFILYFFVAHPDPKPTGVICQ